jgi:hypothetical protein
MPVYLDDQELEGLSFMVASLFDGVPISQVRPVLDRAENILLSGHAANTRNPRIKAIAEECEVSDGVLESYTIKSQKERKKCILPTYRRRSRRKA